MVYNHRNFSHIKLCTGILISLILLSCVSQKKKGEYKGLRKFYHNTTAKYNAFFNARELMVASVEKLSDGHKDNYGKVLPVFPYEAIEDATSEKPNLDKAIEKVASDINQHRYSRWADDCYFLLCKAQYLKKDYETAENSYEFMLNEYQPSRILASKNLSSSEKAKKVKKEKEKKKEDAKKEAKRRAKEKEKARQKAREALRKKAKQGSSVKDISNEEIMGKSKSEKKKDEVKKEELKVVTNVGSKLVPHRPIYWEASIWAAKNLIKRGKYYEAEYKLNEIENDPATHEKLKGELYATKANLYLSNENPDKAIQELKKAIDFTSKKKLKARYAYILGQLYQKIDRPLSSDEYFKMVVKFHPDYDMTFHAKMNLLINRSKQGHSTELLISDLEKLAKDSKNADYLGELYYAIAQVHYNSKNTNEAIAGLNQAIQNSQNNNFVKADAYLMLGNIQFELNNFQQAKYYYDSTLTVLTKNDSRRGMVNKFIANLKDIADQLEIINLNDSLIRISGLTTKEKRALAIQLKNRKKVLNTDNSSSTDPLGVNSKVVRSPDFMNRVNARDQIESRFQPANNGKSSFFAYDIKATNRGRSLFEQNWGTRELEDNWRRSKKSIQNSTLEGGVENRVNDSLNVNEVLEEDLAELLKGIPETEEQKQAIHKKIMEAMFQLGVAYRDKIEDYNRSQKTLNELLTRYPLTDRYADVVYYQYLNCLDLNNSECANKNKELLINKFADSYYAKLLTDPEFAKNQMNKKDEITLAYERAYLLFESGNYEESHRIIQALKTNLNANKSLRAKADMLSAFCIGKSSGKDAYMAALKEIVANYPGTPQESKAKEMLRFLRGDKDAFEVVTVSEIQAAEFAQEEDKPHYMLIVFFNPPLKQVDKAKISISDYHAKYNKLDNLKMTSVEINTDNNTSAILVRKFEDKSQAMKYYQSVSRNRDEYVPGYQAYELYPISQNNYRKILDLRSVKEYQDFFKKNYEN
ncbi:MAG: tetratricopeptide repeat protein [Saprospiraceae bacterium]|nr:tetratricopeptide repeat protein [Saprospiraceae bacterium]